MTRTSSPILQLTKTFTFASIFALGLAACGSSSEPLGESRQPISGDSSERPEDAACASGVAPVEANPDECIITARALCFSSHEAACACAGCDLDECAIGESFPAQAFCPSGGGGSDPERPVSDDADAPVSSDPGGGVTGSPGNGGTEPGNTGSGSNGNPGRGSPGGAPSGCDDGHAPDPDGRCDFVVGDACFDSAESACARAGCELERCVVRESYPAQVSCS